MNQGFFSLEKEKQIKIINAGFQVFAQNEYSKAPVAEIAVAAGIGYMHMAVMQKTLNAEQIMVDFEKLISMWKTVYGRS